tara:strand:+ start:7225 stop:7857 length:633 start_codon:yes stop_codon:yes gene_type:complete
MSEDVKVQVHTLGEIIIKIEMPKTFIDEINNVFDEKEKTTIDWTTQLAGKIKKEKLVNYLLDDSIKGTFQMCFQEYMKRAGLVLQQTHQVVLDNAWINDMFAGEYNPCHFHASKNSLVGLSSVLFLKTPDTYGEEIINPQTPSNGHLEFIGGQQHSLAISQLRLSPKVGDFFIFPYTLVHTVYPFSGTDQVRRTLSYNCDIVPKILVKAK